MAGNSFSMIYLWKITLKVHFFKSNNTADSYLKSPFINQYTLSFMSLKDNLSKQISYMIREKKKHILEHMFKIQKKIYIQEKSQSAPDDTRGHNH